MDSRVRKEILRLVKEYGKAKAASDEVLANKIYNELARFLPTRSRF